MARRIVLVCWCVLFALVWCWQLRSHAFNSAAFNAVLLSIPLLLPLHGLINGRRYTYAWATLCVLPYLVVGITETIANAGTRAWTGTILGAALLFFFALIMFLRITRRPSEIDDADAKKTS